MVRKVLAQHMIKNGDASRTACLRNRITIFYQNSKHESLPKIGGGLYWFMFYLTVIHEDSIGANIPFTFRATSLRITNLRYIRLNSVG